MVQQGVCVALFTRRREDREVVEMEVVEMEVAEMVGGGFSFHKPMPEAQVMRNRSRSGMLGGGATGLVAFSAFSSTTLTLLVRTPRL